MNSLSRPASLLALATFLALPFASALAQGPGAGGPRVQMPNGVAISPSGKTVAWTLRHGEESTLHLTEVTGLEPSAQPSEDRIVTPGGAAACSNTSPVWSPDGETLAFLSTCKAEKAGQAQIYLWSRPSGEIRELTHLSGNLQQLAWSPDGKSIAFLFVQNATRTAGALDAMKPFAGVIGEDNVEVQGVYAVNVASGEGEWLVPATQAMYAYEFSWAPDSRRIAFIGAKAPGENNWWIAKLYTAGIPRHTESQTSDRNGSSSISSDVYELKAVVDPGTVAGPLHGLQIAVPRWSPDGKKIAFIGGLMSDQGSTGGDVWVVDAQPGASAGKPVDVTPGIDGTPSNEGWHGNETIGFVEDRRGHTLLNAYDVASKSPITGVPFDLGEVSVSGGAIKDAVSVSDNGTFAFVKQSFSTPPEIWTGSATGQTQLTHLNTNVKPAPKTVSLEWENEGFHVQGWLTFPKDYDPARKYPMIVQVHGGPSSSIVPRWGGGNWSDGGYFEFQPNPRGSFGQGEAFTQANRKDFGYGDLRDILKGMDRIEAQYPVDKQREGLTGWSYGGFMTMFAVTQTHRFRAAVAGAGLSDWLSYYGENSIDQWMIPFFGASVYDDPAVYAKSSAITYIKNVKTPTLVIVGDRDGECPAPQSFEFWHALRDLGVKTQLVVYPDEGHGFRNPAHLKDRAEREAKWFAEYMPAQ